MSYEVILIDALFLDRDRGQDELGETLIDQMTREIVAVQGNARA